MNKALPNVIRKLTDGRHLSPHHGAQNIELLLEEPYYQFIFVISNPIKCNGILNNKTINLRMSRHEHKTGLSRRGSDGYMCEETREMTRFFFKCKVHKIKCFFSQYKLYNFFQKQFWSRHEWRWRCAECTPSSVSILFISSPLIEWNFSKKKIVPSIIPPHVNIQTFVQVFPHENLD